MSWLHYLMEANLYLVIFYLCYCLFLNRETYYTFNRVYLLFTSLAAFVLPMFQLGVLKPATITAPVEYVTASVVPLAQNAVKAATPVNVNPAFNWDDALVYVYMVGVGIFLLVLLFKLYKLMRLAHMSKIGEKHGYLLVQLDEQNTAFSFFKYLFIGTSPVSADTIIRHELVHIRQKHSVDIIFIELIKAFNWFNPIIYLMQRSLRAVHEYIADEQTASSGDGAISYSSFLVENAYGLSGTSVTHSIFNYNLLKKRIIMLNQQRSGKLARLKYLVIVPLCAGMLCLSTLAFSKSYGLIDLLPKNLDSLHLQPRYDIWNKSTDKTFTTAKGYKVHEKIIFVDGAVSKTATIYDEKGNGTFYDERWVSAATTKALYEKYGYRFPIDTVIKKKLPPPPQPKPPHAKTDLRPQGTKVSPKGYNYTESGYMIDGKSDYRVLIWDGREQKEYWKSKTSVAEAKILKDKYGYIFPNMPIYSKLPPPPPMMPASARPKVAVPPTPADGKYQSEPPVAIMDQKAPPPPPAPPVGKGSAKVIGDRSLMMTIDSEAFTRNDLKGDRTPVIVVNGSVYKLKEPLKKGQDLLVDAKGGAHAVMYSGNDLQDAINKYGENAKNGVIYAYGETSVQVK